LRGMHFQLPPAAHDKLVYCPVGKVLDVVLDLRSSAKRGRFISRELNASNREMLFIPRGCAHGFVALEDESMMVYQTSTVHSPAHDAGVLWNSFGFAWPVANPILSERDQKFPALRDFKSPF
jgi:dTDP-4-dehydrorhamnose 3,5-epimerase